MEITVHAKKQAGMVRKRKKNSERIATIIAIYVQCAEGEKGGSV